MDSGSLLGGERLGCFVIGMGTFTALVLEVVFIGFVLLVFLLWLFVSCLKLVFL